MLLAPTVSSPPCTLDRRTLRAVLQCGARTMQTAMYVWESTCRPCWGTGSITSSSRRGRRTSYVCPTCHGLGELLVSLLPIKDSPSLAALLVMFQLTTSARHDIQVFGLQALFVKLRPA